MSYYLDFEVKYKGVVICSGRTPLVEEFDCFIVPFKAEGVEFNAYKRHS